MLDWEERYPMSRNINSDKAHRLARQLAERTGETMTEAVTRGAGDEWLDRARHQHGSGSANRLLAIGKDCATHLKEPYRAINHGEMRYDDLGLPR